MNFYLLFDYQLNTTIQNIHHATNSPQHHGGGEGMNPGHASTCKDNTLLPLAEGKYNVFN